MEAATAARVARIASTDQQSASSSNRDERTHHLDVLADFWVSDELIRYDHSLITPHDSH